MACLCCQAQKPESVETYRDLNEFLLDADHAGRLEEDGVVGNGKNLTVIGFFQNVLTDDESPTKPKQSQRPNDETFGQLL